MHTKQSPPVAPQLTSPNCTINHNSAPIAVPLLCTLTHNCGLFCLQLVYQLLVTGGVDVADQPAAGSSRCDAAVMHVQPPCQVARRHRSTPGMLQGIYQLAHSCPMALHGHESCMTAVATAGANLHCAASSLQDQAHRLTTAHCCCCTTCVCPPHHAARNCVHRCLLTWPSP